MGVILQSTWEGWGSAALAQACQYTPLKSPPFLEAFVYGTTTSLVSRLIEHVVPEEKNIIVVLALKILAPYLVNQVLERGLRVGVPMSSIHLENGIYLLALLDGEAVRGKTPFNSHRVSAHFIHILKKRYFLLFD